MEVDHCEKDLKEEKVRLEALEKRVEGKEGGSSYGELVSAVGVMGCRDG